MARHRGGDTPDAGRRGPEMDDAYLGGVPAPADELCEGRGAGGQDALRGGGLDRVA